MKILLSIILFLLLLATYACAAPTPPLGSRDIGCDKIKQKRENDICQSISRNLSWTWTGHAIISPGWRLGWDGLRTVYCEMNVNDEDLPILRPWAPGGEYNMNNDIDPRLRFGFEGLVRLLDNKDGKSTDHSILHPVYGDSYLLKDGCPK